MIPDQAQADLDKPEEHFLWALHNLPTIAGTGALCHPAILRRWSKHLVECGFAHTDHLAKLADDNGNIHVSQLPKQQIKKIPALRGPRHVYNNAAAWVPVDTPAPEPMRIPDIHKLTIQENAAMLKQYEEAGMIPPLPPDRDTAEEVN